uniref:EthD family reductase n=1 Tax=Rhodococcus qingshengii TaxID=334542 RepID=UPI001C4E15BB|nr:EthD family reductase [Rhodococcus qingshengii]
MFRISICYHHPDDPTAFDEHYRRIHAPLVDALPRLAGYTAGRCQALTPTTPAPYHLVTQLFFTSAQDMRTALASVEMRRASKDMANFATAGAITYWSEDLDLPLRDSATTTVSQGD